MNLFRSVLTTTLAAFLATGVGSMAPAMAKASKPAATADKKADKKTDKKAEKKETKTISGEIATWSDKDFSLKVGAVNWKFAYDKAHCAILGKAAVGAKATVKYTKEGDAKTATSIRIAKSDKKADDKKADKKADSKGDKKASKKGKK